MQHRSLPIDPDWDNDDSYVSSLLSFATSSDIFRNLCGGIHILDFLTREPDLYNTVLPRKWRDWFDIVTINDVLDLLLHEDLQQFGLPTSGAGTQYESWRGY